MENPAALQSETQDSSGEAVYARLRADTVLGRLAPGRKLGLEGLRQIYGAGVGTLREALNRLASEGLVVAEGQRGFSVAPVSAADFAEVAELRLLLECHAVHKSFAAGDLDWEGRVVGAHHKLAMLERRLLAGEPADAALWKRYDREFHQALIEACGSAALLETYAAAYDRYLRYQMVAVVFRGAVAATQHADLLHCALARDAAGACRLLEAHVAGCVEHVVSTGTLVPFASTRPCPAPEAATPTAGERAYRLIRADILRGTLAPGQKLKLDALRDAYDAGLGTLRETLSRLIAERLVVAEGQRGFEVAPFSPADLRDIANLRLLLEGHALDQAFHAGDVEWEGRVVAIHHKLSQAEERLHAGDGTVLETWRRFDSQFHETLISACGSRTLMATHAAVFDRYQRYQYRALGFRGAIAIREHAALRDCALRRDAPGARAVMARHILGGVDQALASGAL
ncbi:GntR family transcriptional regulator [Humitalea sp. 24SJ18S-53]|uniref:GntR family transcriptional regulator n=1 Tax=Humitalea sp. 24SJ18S-53 TaxID=3422307 RepID=UPI003D67B474